MNIYESITKIMQEVPSIKKKKKNAQQGFMYRGIDDVMNVFQPLLAKHKVFIVPQVLEQKREDRISSKGSSLIYSVCTIKYTFYAEDGSFVEAITVGEGMDSGDKATNKAMAIAMKYALFQVFCIPTQDDPDSTTPPETTPDPKKQLLDEKDAKILHDVMERKGIIVESSLPKMYGVNTTSELTVAQKVDIMKKISELPDVK